MPSDIKDKIKIFRFFIIGILCLFIFIIFSLSFFYLAGIERGAVSRNIPGSVKNPIKTAYAGLKNAVIKIEDLPYIIYRFKPSSLPVYNLTIDQKDWNFLNKNLPDPDNWREIYYDEKYNKLSKDKKKTYKILTVLQRKLMHLVHDIIDRGICYRYEAKKRIKEIHYHKKPNWKNVRK